jgi:hypothetical protein
VLISLVAAGFIFANSEPGPPFNPPAILATVLIVLPMLATVALERYWFSLGWAVSRPMTTTVLSLPIGLLVYTVSVFFALMIAVNVGVLLP